MNNFNVNYNWDTGDAVYWLEQSSCSRKVPGSIPGEILKVLVADLEAVPLVQVARFSI